jgi:hypothetical protein
MAGQASSSMRSIGRCQACWPVGAVTGMRLIASVRGQTLLCAYEQIGISMQHGSNTAGAGVRVQSMLHRLHAYSSQKRAANSFGESPGSGSPWCGRSL